MPKKWREIEAREAETRGWRYKVVEQGGRQIRSVVCKNPWTGPCIDEHAMSAQQGGQATVGNLDAPTRCNAWPARSEDQTQYQNLKRLDKTSNAMIRHNNIYHRSQKVPYQMSVVSLHKEPVGRLLREGVDIVAGNQTILLNSKEEFLQGAVPSTRTQRGFGR